MNWIKILPPITAINFLVKWFKMFGFTLPNSLSIHVTFFLNVLVLMREVKCFKISSNLIYGHSRWNFFLSQSTCKLSYPKYKYNCFILQFKIQICHSNILFLHFSNCRICTCGIFGSISYISEMNQALTTKIYRTRPQRAMANSPETNVVITTRNQP